MQTAATRNRSSSSSFFRVLTAIHLKMPKHRAATMSYPVGLNGGHQALAFKVGCCCIFWQMYGLCRPHFQPVPRLRGDPLRFASLCRLTVGVSCARFAHSASGVGSGRFARPAAGVGSTRFAAPFAEMLRTYGRPPSKTFRVPRTVTRVAKTNFSSSHTEQQLFEEHFLAPHLK